MGRPRVRPEDRRRAPLACVSCQTSKKRCDSRIPCATCIHRRQQQRCTYAESARRRQIVHALDSSTRSSASDSVARDREQPCGEQQTPATVAEEERESSAEETVQSFPSPESRMLLSSKGETMFIGETASLSFLQFLRHTLRRCMGPSAFTDNGHVDQMLEADLEDGASDRAEGDGEYRRAMIGCYFGATCGILNVYTEDELLEFSEAEPNRLADLDPSHTAALQLALAIGRQVSALTEAEAKAATIHFFRARQIAFQGMLMDPTVDLVRLFLMMSFYLLGACRRNGASMYLGIASKAATSLGLHELSRRAVSRDPTFDVRYRTWQSLRILETIVTAVLGRHNSVPTNPLSPVAARDLENTSHCHLALDATFSVTSYIDMITHKLDHSNTIDTGTADHILQQLRLWSSNLKPELRRFSSSQSIIPDLEEREALIGNTHVSCVYYFSVILITRPFLIQHLSTSLRNQASNGPAPEKARHTSQKTFQLAQACVDSAVFMSQICFRASESGLLFNNMCLLKAFVFVAGLVLGFSLFVQDDDGHEKEQAFYQARRVLQFLARLSPQAEHYFQILSSFSETITRHRQHLKEERRRLTTRYVDRILDFDAENMRNDVDQISPFSTIDGISNFDAVAPSTIDTLSEETMAGLEAELNILNNSLGLSWDDPTPQSSSLYSDQFPLACEAFEKIWDGLI